MANLKKESEEALLVWMETLVSRPLSADAWQKVSRTTRKLNPPNPQHLVQLIYVYLIRLQVENKMPNNSIVFTTVILQHRDEKLYPQILDNILLTPALSRPR